MYVSWLVPFLPTRLLLGLTPPESALTENLLKDKSRTNYVVMAALGGVSLPSDFVRMIVCWRVVLEMLG